MPPLRDIKFKGMGARKLVSTFAVSGLLILVVLIGQVTPSSFRPDLPPRATVLPGGESSALPNAVDSYADAARPISQGSPPSDLKESEATIHVGARQPNPMATPNSASPTGMREATGVTPAASGSVSPWAGYLGNAVIYPTNYTGDVILSPISALGNQSFVCSNQQEAMNNTVLISVASGAAQYQYANVSGVHQLQIGIVETAFGGSQYFPDGDPSNGYYATVGAVQDEYTYSGLPSNSSGTPGVWIWPAGGAAPLLGLNTSGHMPNATENLAWEPYVDAALQIAGVFFGPLGYILSGVAVMNDLLTFAGPYSGNGETSSWVTKGPSGEVWNTAAVNNGTYNPNQYVGYGSNVFSQALHVTMFYPIDSYGFDLPYTPSTSAKISLAGENFVWTDGGSSACYGADSPSISYGFAPAVGLGGQVNWLNGAPVTGANVTVYQNVTGGASSTFNEVTNSTTGKWHFFGDPASNTSYSFRIAFSDPLGTYTSPFYPISSKWTTQADSDWEQFHESMGGRVSGDVLGNDGPTWGPVVGANVSLCNNKGCIYTTSGGGGAYAFNFPVAGTSSNPYVIEIAATGRPTSTTSNLLLPLGVTTQLNVLFRPTYSVTFTATGGSGSWSVTLGSVKESASVSSSIVFSGEINSTYAFSVGAPTGYSPSPATGNVTVSGANVSQAIKLNANSYTVTFSESGLPSGTTWSVTLGSSSESASAGSSISFGVTTGSYSYSVPDADEQIVGCELEWYQPSPSSGTISVPNTLSVHITFTFEEKPDATSPGCSTVLMPTGSLGSPPFMLESALGLIVAMAVVAVAWSLLSVRRQGEPMHGYCHLRPPPGNPPFG